MRFEELGSICRQERERRGLSIEEVASRLKIVPRVVRAIEQADIEELPQAAYARGFVKAYGNLLELEPELLHAGMEDAWPDDFYQSPVSYEPAEARESGGKGRLFVAACIGMALILTAAGGFLLFFDPDLRLPSDVLPKAEPALSAKRESPPPPAQAKIALPPESGAQTSARQADPPPDASPAPTVVTPAAPGPAASPAVPADERRTDTLAAAAPQAVPASAAPQHSSHTLIIVALADCLAHSNADNTHTRQFALRKGDAFALTFSTQLVLKLENAGGVKLRLDGRDLDPPGEAGQEKTLTFPASP